mgnify:CR=1 FL=1
MKGNNGTNEALKGMGDLMNTLDGLLSTSSKSMDELKKVANEQLSKASEITDKSNEKTALVDIQSMMDKAISAAQTSDIDTLNKINSEFQSKYVK